LAVSEACSSATAGAIGAGISHDEAFAVHRFAGDNGDAELVFEACHANVEARGHGDIHHVEHKDHRSAEVENLVNEIEISLQIRGVDDAKDPVRLWSIGPPAEQHIARHGFVGRTRGERVCAGEIDDGDGLSVLRVGGADLLLDGHAGIVADLLFQAGERVEERALSAVRVADERIDGSARRRRDGAGGDVSRQRHVSRRDRRGRVPPPICAG
jgi:hypothetical protein